MTISLQGKVLETETAQRPGMIHLLLVEDDDPFRTMLALALSRRGFRVTQACDASRALDFLVQIALRGNREQIPQLLVTDHRLPGFCGLGLIEAARIARMNIPAILITAFGDAEIRDRAALVGATPVLEKPFALEELLTLIGRVAGFGTPLHCLSRDG
ncbi:MAG TPA: response regulator [Myxococcota bacterium]|nr:response regulator [Myxococcota bacterium]